MADVAFEVNRTTQNIGARRLHTILERVVEQVSFEAPDCIVRVDPVWFRQAVDNLVDNALRHTSPGGRVTVRANRRRYMGVLRLNWPGQ